MEEKIKVRIELERVDFLCWKAYVLEEGGRFPVRSNLDRRTLTFESMGEAVDRLPKILGEPINVVKVTSPRPGPTLDGGAEVSYG